MKCVGCNVTINVYGPDQQGTRPQDIQHSAGPKVTEPLVNKLNEISLNNNSKATDK